MNSIGKMSLGFRLLRGVDVSECLGVRTHVTLTASGSGGPGARFLGLGRT